MFSNLIHNMGRERVARKPVQKLFEPIKCAMEYCSCNQCGIAIDDGTIQPCRKCEERNRKENKCLDQKALHAPEFKIGDLVECVLFDCWKYDDMMPYKFPERAGLNTIKLFERFRNEECVVLEKGAFYWPIRAIRHIFNLQDDGKE